MHKDTEKDASILVLCSCTMLVQRSGGLWTDEEWSGLPSTFDIKVQTQCYLKEGRRVVGKDDRWKAMSANYIKILKPGSGGIHL